MSKKMLLTGPLTCLAVLLVIGLGAPAGVANEPAAGANPTVADFVTKLADALNGSSEPITTVEVALHSFAARGITIPSGLDLSAALTEGDVAAICRALNLDVVPSESQRLFDSESVDGFVGFLRGEYEQGRLPRGGTGADAGPTLTVSGLGACCDMGVCTQTTPGLCGGVYRGKGIPCTPDPCLPGKGTCCVERQCSITFPQDCPGVFRGSERCKVSTCRHVPPASPSDPR